MLNQSHNNSPYCKTRRISGLISVTFLFHDSSDPAGDFSLLGRQLVLDHLGNAALQVGIRQVGYLGVSFVELLDHVASQIYFSPDDSLHLGVRVLAGFGSDVDFVRALPDVDADTHEVSVGNGPNGLVLLIVDFEDIFLLIEYLDFNHLRVDLGKRLLLSQEFNNLLDVVVDHGSALGCNPTINIHLEHGARLRSVLFPSGGVLKLLQALQNICGILLKLVIVVGSLHLLHHKTNII